MAKKKKKKKMPEQVQRQKDFLDMIAPAAVKFNTDHFILGSRYHTAMALKSYPPMTDELALLRGLGDMGGVNLRLTARQVTPAEEDAILHAATNKSRMERSNTNDYIEKHLNGQTLQEHMEDVLDELCNQLPEREYTRISKAIQAGSSAAREREEAAQTWSAYRVLENGEEWCFKVAPGEELLNAAERLNRYLNTSVDTGSKFIRLFSCGTLLTSGEYQQMIAERMENTGKVTGVFELDFDKREFSAVHIMDGWRTWAMQDVSAAVYHATRSQFASSDDKWRKLLDHLSGKEITSAGHLSARIFSFGDEIIESDGKLNFYVQTEFDVDAAFGTFVLTDKNDDWLNIYANYDIAEDRPCDTLELTLCKGDGSEESWSYPLNAAEQEVLMRKMEEYCQQQTGMSLHDYAQQFREEPEQQQGPVMKL